MPNNLNRGDGFWITDDGSYGVGAVYIVEEPKLIKLLTKVAESEGENSRFRLIQEMLGEDVVSN